VGARIRIRPADEEKALGLFASAGFTPIHIERRDDGILSFWFGKMPGDELLRLAEAIPRDMYAMQAIIR
jgi:hypothetical protein